MYCLVVLCVNLLVLCCFASVFGVVGRGWYSRCGCRCFLCLFCCWLFVYVDPCLLLLHGYSLLFAWVRWVVVSFDLWILIWLCLRYIWCLAAGLCWFDCLWFVVFGVYCLVL